MASFDPTDPNGLNPYNQYTEATDWADWNARHRPAVVASNNQRQQQQRDLLGQVNQENANQRNQRLGGGAPLQPGAGFAGNGGQNNGHGIDPYSAMMLGMGNMFSGMPGAAASMWDASQNGLASIANTDMQTGVQRDLGMGALANQKMGLGNNFTLGNNYLNTMSGMNNARLGALQNIFGNMFGGKGGSGGGLGGLLGNIFGSGAAGGGAGALSGGFGTPLLTGFKATNGPQSASFGGQASPTTFPQQNITGNAPPAQNPARAMQLYNRRYVPEDQLPMYDAAHGLNGGQ